MDEFSFNGLISKAVEAHEREVAHLRGKLQASRTEIKRLHEILGSQQPDSDFKESDSIKSLNIGDVDEPFPPSHPQLPHPPAPQRDPSDRPASSPVTHGDDNSLGGVKSQSSMDVADEECPFYPKRNSDLPSDLISENAMTSLRSVERHDSHKAPGPIRRTYSNHGVSESGQASVRTSVGGAFTGRQSFVGHREAKGDFADGVHYSIPQSTRSSFYQMDPGYFDVPIINITACLNIPGKLDVQDIDDLDDPLHDAGPVMSKHASTASTAFHLSRASSAATVNSRQPSMVLPHGRQLTLGMGPNRSIPSRPSSVAASRRQSGAHSMNLNGFAGSARPSLAAGLEEQMQGIMHARNTLQMANPVTTQLPTVRSKLTPGSPHRPRKSAGKSYLSSAVKRVRLAFGSSVDGHDDKGWRRRSQNSLVVPSGPPPEEDEGETHVKFRDKTSIVRLSKVAPSQGPAEEEEEVPEGRPEDHVKFAVETDGEVKFENHLHLEVRPEWIIKGGEEEKLQKARAESQRQSMGNIMLDEHGRHSLNSLDYEEKSKLVLDPTSRPQVCWDTVALIFLLFDLIAAPLTVFRIDDAIFITFMLWMTTIFWTADFIRSFFLGFYGEGDIVKVLRRVICHYLSSWCIVDFGLLTYDWLSLVHGEEMRNWRWLRLMRCHKMWRFYSLIQFDLEALSASETANVMSTIGITVFFILVINHLIACGWYAVGRACIGHHDNWLEKYELWPSSSVAYRYTTAYHWALTQFTPASIAIQPHNEFERVYSIIVLLFAIMLISTLVSTVTKAVTQIQAIRANKTKQLWLLNKYLRSSQVPTPLALRIQHYCNYAWGRQEMRLNESNIQLLDLLSAPLRAELQMAILEPRFSFHPFFLLITKVAPRIATRICHSASCFVSVNPGDFLFSAGQQASHTFFIVAGVLTYNKQVDDWHHDSHNNRPSTESGEIYAEVPQMHEEQVGEDDIVTEPVLWAEWQCVGTLQAEAECDVVGIEARKFGILVKSNPTSRQEAQMFARSYVNGLNRLQMSQLSDLHQSQLVEGLWFRLLRDFKVTREDYRDSRGI